MQRPLPGVGLLPAEGKALLRAAGAANPRAHKHTCCSLHRRCTLPRRLLLRRQQRDGLGPRLGLLRLLRLQAR